MGSYSDATSDLDDELPVFDFLQPGRQLGQLLSDADKKDVVHLDDCKAEDAAISSTAKGNMGECARVADVMMISSSSDDDDAPYVPLVQRLKERQGKVICASSTVRNGIDAHQCSPSNLASCQKKLPESVNCRASDGSEEEVAAAVALPQRWLPQKPLSSTGSTDMSPAKRKPAKWTAEEIQASREEGLKRRQIRERQQRDKEALRLEQERQKAERKALAEASKALRPDECIKHMVVAVDPALLQLEGGGSLLTSLQALGCSCAIEKQPIPRSVSWMRRVACAQNDIVCVPETYVVMQVAVDDFITLIHSYIQEERHGKSDSGPTLTSWVQEQQTCNPGKVLSLVVIDLEKYFRSHKSQSQKKFREAVSRVEVEEALVHLQLHTGVSVRVLSTWKDFSDHISMTTKAVAEAPFKREREQTGFSFYLESEWAGGQRVDKAGKGLMQVWKRQIQQLNRVSPDIASAILAAYASPQLLKKAWALCKTEHDKVSLLSDLLIRRGEGVTSTTRRVGPELSKRLFIMMNSCDPEQTLDSTM
ncbi:hypothetical protein Q5P01_024026 [Channa striata]|uniref:Structure-specific endonuclease subunit EME2 n=1 Tax=Channa striata TaxID=64152 RepID=A0AA88IXG4_CHASR|nr:hypothetical protein Q5P01_024026 [Channa striata]